MKSSYWERIGDFFKLSNGTCISISSKKNVKGTNNRSALKLQAGHGGFQFRGRNCRQGCCVQNYLVTGYFKNWIQAMRWSVKLVCRPQWDHDPRSDSGQVLVLHIQKVGCFLA